MACLTRHALGLQNVIASERHSSLSVANPATLRSNRSRLFEPTPTPRPLSLVVLACFRIDARRRAGQYAHFNERFRWSRSTPEIDVPEPMFIRARKAPDFPPVFTVVSALSRLISGGLVVCSQRALLPHQQLLQGASLQSVSEHALTF